MNKQVMTKPDFDRRDLEFIEFMCNQQIRSVSPLNGNPFAQRGKAQAQILLEKVRKM